MKPGPWEIRFHSVPRSHRGSVVGFYVSRTRPDWSAPNAREWLHDKRGKLARFASSADALSAIDNHTSAADVA